LQVAGFHVLEGERAGRSLIESLRAAEEEMRALKPDAWR
jgi:hypothetical protein